MPTQSDLNLIMQLCRTYEDICGNISGKFSSFFKFIIR